MKTELKIHVIDPEEPLHDGIQNRKWVSKEEMTRSLPLPKKANLYLEEMWKRHMEMRK